MAADPHEWPGLAAGGEVAAKSAFPGCAGYIADPEEPDFRLLDGRDSRRGPLGLWAGGGGGDLVLVVEEPSGRMRCDDDYSALSGGRPELLFSAAQAGGGGLQGVDRNPRARRGRRRGQFFRFAAGTAAGMGRLSREWRFPTRQENPVIY